MTRARWTLCRAAAAAVLLVVAAAAAAEGPPQAPRDGLFLVPDSVRAEIGEATRVHRYQGAVLVQVHGRGGLAPDAASRLHRVERMDRVGFGSWGAEYPAPDTEKVVALGGGVFVVALVGPVDQGWVQALHGLGMRVLGTTWPYGLVVEADGAQLGAALGLATSEGFAVVRGVLELPVEARLSRDLASGELGGTLEVRLSTFRAPDLESVLAELDPVAAAGKRLGPRSAVLRVAGPELLDALARLPEIAHVEPVYANELHNNLAARAGLLAVQPVWEELGCNGTGVIVAHNDSGVDLDHAAFPPGTIVATRGRMSYTDTGHGTHTDGSIAGRGTVEAPVNESGCGDLGEPLATARGMAWGATLVSNNIFDGGLAEVQDMMQWAARQGAWISSNSWGHRGEPSQVFIYATSSAAVDAAVRDADPDTAAAEPLAVVFSAGNLGPGPGTVSAPGNAKNALTVGASQNDRCGVWVPDRDQGPDVDAVISISGRGPSQGRIKPDLVAPGSDVLSAQSGDWLATARWDDAWTGDELALGSGTSMSCALAAGAAAVLAEHLWRESARRPSPALLKAALVNGAVDTGLGYPSMEQGWGRLDLERAVSGPPGGRITSLDQDEVTPLATGQTWSHDLEVFSSTVPLELTLVWTDPPGEADSDHPLVNDLDLVVRAPDGTVFRGNRFTGGESTANPGATGDGDNNVEHVVVPAPAPGGWSVEVVAVNVATPPPGLAGQDFAFVYSGDAAECEAPEPPAGVEAAAAGANRIDLAWDPVPGATEYAVLRSDEEGGRPYYPLATVEGGSTGYSDTSAEGGITYYYVVRARAGCWSADSLEVAAVTTGTCSLPPVFAGLAGVEDGNGVTCTVQLSWPAATAPCGGAVRYSVYRDTTPDLQPGPGNLVASGLPATTHADLGLDPARTYYYVVRATDTSNGLEDGNQVVVSARASGPDSVFLERSCDSSTGWLTQAGSGDTGTSPWHLAEDELRSPPSAWHCADQDRVTDQSLVLAAPVQLPEGSTAVLEFWHLFGLEEEWDGGRLEYSVDGGTTWYDILHGNGYSVADDPERFVAGGYTHQLVELSNTNPLAGEAAWSGLSRGWQQVVVDLAGFGGQPLLLRWRLGCNADSSEGHGWWIDDVRLDQAGPCQRCTAPPAPAAVAAEAQERGILLTWDGVDGATGYGVLRASEAQAPLLPLATVAAPQVRYFDTLVSGGTTYRYAVQADTGCLSEVSAEAGAEALGPCLQPPVFYGLAAAAAAREPVCAVDLAWPEATGGCSEQPRYRVFRSTEPDFAPGPRTVIADGVVGTGFRDLRVGDGLTYHYVVRAVDPVNGLADANVKPRSATVRGADVELLGDDMESGAGGWTALPGSPADSGTQPWTLLDTGEEQTNHAWFCSDEPVVKDQVLALAEPVLVSEVDTAVLEFRQRFDFDVLWDGGRLEYSTDGGTTWHDILSGDGATVPDDADRFVTGGYNGTLLSLPATNPLAGSRAWTGRRGDWSTVRVDLSDFGGTSLLLRWRLGCDSVQSTVGWWLDDVHLFFVDSCALPIRNGGPRVR